MASEGKGQLDNNLKGLNYQQFTLLYVIKRLLQNENVEDFKIGNAMKGFGALDDVVFEVKLKNKQIITYAIQAKHSIKDITVGYFRDKSDTYAFKYFQSFLEIKERLPPKEIEKIGQLILWTTMEIKPKVKKDWFVKYEPQISLDGDLLGPCGESDEIERYRFKNKDDDKGDYPEFANGFLDRLHPCMKLVETWEGDPDSKNVETFVNVLLKKDVLKSDGEAKDCQNVMVNEIIDCKGERPTFRQAFIDGDKTKLQADTMEFRKCFESVISQKFSEKRYGQFSMTKLNDGYEKYIELKVDEQFGMQTDPKARWPDWKKNVVAVESDLQEFFERFLFYVSTPEENRLKGIVMKSDVDGFDQYSGLIKIFSEQQMINKEQINQISTLIRLRKTMDVGPYIDLKFGCTKYLRSKVKHLLNSEESQLVIKSTMNVDCTVSKLISVVETCLVPESKRYLVFTSANFATKMQELLPLLTNDNLLERALKCIIVSFVDSDQIEGIIAKLSSKKIKIILVGNGLEKGLEDKLNIALLDEACKNKIRNTFISLSASQKATADTIFSADLFQTDNLDLILGLHLLYCSKSTLEIRSNELKRCDNFKSRRLIRKYGGSGDCVASFAPTVISDQAGTGKTEEMVNHALKERQEWNGHLVLYLDCIDIVKKFTGNIQDTICKMITPNDDMKSALIKELFKLGKVSLFMDNYDEVSESFNAKLQNLLKEIARAKIHKLYIATRPHCEAQIIDIFPQSIVYSLEPFSGIDQLDYVKTLWGWHTEKNESMRHLIEDNAIDLINWYRPIPTLLKTPLYIHMIATINRDGDSKKFLSLGAIFEKFIDYKFEHYKFDEANHFLQDIVKAQMRDIQRPKHGLMAFKMFTDAPEAEVKDLCQTLQMYGIVHLEPSPGFIHQTFQEYFLVLYFLTAPCRAIADHWPKFVRRILGTQQTDTALEFLDFHIKPNQSYPDLIRHICNFLYEHCSESERAELVQRSDDSKRRKLLGVLRKSLELKTVQ